MESLELQDYVTLNNGPIKSEKTITGSNFVKLHIMKKTEQSLLWILNIQGNVIVKDEKQFVIKSLEYIELIIK